MPATAQHVHRIHPALHFGRHVREILFFQYWVQVLASPQQMFSLGQKSCLFSWRGGVNKKCCFLVHLSVFVILWFFRGGDEKDFFWGGEQVYIHKCFKFCVILTYLEGINILEVSTTCSPFSTFGATSLHPKAANLLYSIAWNFQLPWKSTNKMVASFGWWWTHKTFRYLKWRYTHLYKLYARLT